MTTAGFEHLLRELTPQVLGVLIRRCRDFAAAEDAVQEALLAAATQWPGDGVPANPRAWLIQVASHKLTDQIRSDTARRRREAEAAMEAGYAMPAASPHDDTLVLIQMCCHRSLTTASAIALTLRAVGGLTTAEIARAFLVPESTMAQRISRARQTIRDSGVAFEATKNLAPVLHTLYLIFNEGYTASGGGSLQRTDLTDEAIRLARLVHALAPADTEAAGLLALMLLTDARRGARTAGDGEIIPLDKQDRALWDHGRIAEGVALLRDTLPKGEVGPYQLQAAIAAVHDEAATHQDTDWPQILALYEMLDRVSSNPMVKLNRAVAAAMVHGPRAGLAMLGELDGDPRLKEHHRLASVRAHLLEMAGETEAAVRNFQTAAARTASLPERHYLLAQAARLRER